MTRPEDPFKEVQKLLGCKKYEQPPPGYFLSFSDKVIARIEAEEYVQYSSSWWSWLVERFDAKPAFVCIYGLAVSGLLFMGFRLSQIFEAEAATAPSLAGPLFAASQGSSMLFSGDLSHVAALGSSLGSTWSSGARWALNNEPTSLLIPANSFQLQPTTFKVDER